MQVDGVYSGGKVRPASVSLLLELWPACSGSGGVRLNGAAAEGEIRRLCCNSIGLLSSHGRFLDSMDSVRPWRLQVRTWMRHPSRASVADSCTAAIYSECLDGSVRSGPDAQRLVRQRKWCKSGVDDRYSVRGLATVTPS